MCYSEASSWTSLTVGTIINLLAIAYLLPRAKTRDRLATSALCCIVALQYSLFMQIPDGIAWRQINHGGTPTSGKLAYVLNVTQPLITLMAVGAALIWTKDDLKKLIPAAVVCGLYVIALAYNLKDADFNIAPKKGCRHLMYKWWNTPFLTGLYLLSMVVVLWTLPSPLVRYLCIAIFLLSFLLSIAMAFPCGSGSLWCFLVAPGGLIIFLGYLFSRSKLK